MTTYLQTDSDNPHFQQLATALEAELRIRDGEDHEMYAQLNQIDTIQHAMVAYQNGQPVGCGAFRPYNETTMELKRMYVPESLRGQGIASGILQALEAWAVQLGYQKFVLETGNNQPEAVALYLKKGYRSIPNFGRYIGSANSVCFEKSLYG